MTLARHTLLMAVAFSSAARARILQPVFREDAELAAEPCHLLPVTQRSR
jgi:hypothetical protein